MPFVGKTPEGERVYGPEAQVDMEVYCPGCGGEMYHRQSHIRQGSHVASHFVHMPDTEDCGWVGESEKHNRMKWKAASWVQELDAVSDVEFESQVGSRRADVLARIEPSTVPFGKGVVVEVQHKNEAKDIEAVQTEYLDAGYSVCWLWDGDFTEHGVAHEHPIEIATTVWPNAVPKPDNGASYYPDYPAPEPEPTATFPVEWFAEPVKEAVERGRWKAGHSEEDRRAYVLGENNAERSCITCGAEAIAYEHEHGFQCNDCLGSVAVLRGHTDRLEST